MPEIKLLDLPQQSDSEFAATLDVPPEQAASKPAFIGILARVYWVLVGNAAVYLAGLAIALQGPDHTWVTDIVFWAAVGSLALVRYLDIAFLHGATGSGEPASLRVWYRYAKWLVLISLAVWTVAHGVAQLGL